MRIRQWKDSRVSLVRWGEQRSNHSNTHISTACRLFWHFPCVLLGSSCLSSVREANGWEFRQEVQEDWQWILHKNCAYRDCAVFCVLNFWPWLWLPTWQQTTSNYQRDYRCSTRIVWVCFGRNQAHSKSPFHVANVVCAWWRRTFFWKFVANCPSHLKACLWLWVIVLLDISA